jgi:hypothetical protein
MLLNLLMDEPKSKLDLTEKVSWTNQLEEVETHSS